MCMSSSPDPQIYHCVTGEDGIYCDDTLIHVYKPRDGWIIIPDEQDCR